MAAAPTSYPIFPANDWAIKVSLKDVDPVSGSVIPLADGSSVDGFLATSNLPTASAADPTLTATATGLAGGSGQWIISLSAGQLAAALMNSLFSSTPPFLIVECPGDVRVYIPLIYIPVRPAILS